MPRREIALALLAAPLLTAASPAQAGAQLAAAPPATAPQAADERQLFALILRPGPAWKPGRPFAEQGLRDHFHYWMGLFRQGHVASAGPLGGDSGLVLLLARGLTDAEAIVRADPAITAGIFTGDVRPYAPPMVNGGLLADKAVTR